MVLFLWTLCCPLVFSVSLWHFCLITGLDELSGYFGAASLDVLMKIGLFMKILAFLAYNGIG